MSQVPLPAIVGAAVGGAALAVLLVLLWFLFTRSTAAHRNCDSEAHSHIPPTDPYMHHILKPSYSHSLQSPDPVWLSDQKGRSSPSDSHSQASSRYGSADSAQLKISAPMPQRPRRASNNATLPGPGPALPPPSPADPLPPFPPPPATGSIQIHQKRGLQGILEDETAVATRVKERLLTGPGARWLEKEPDLPSRSRARIKEMARTDTLYSRQSFMTATSASVYSDHGPEPVGVAYGGEEYE